MESKQDLLDQDTLYQGRLSSRNFLLRNAIDGFLLSPFSQRTIICTGSRYFLSSPFQNAYMFTQRDKRKTLETRCFHHRQRATQCNQPDEPGTLLV